jgi:toxin YhaV
LKSRSKATSTSDPGGTVVNGWRLFGHDQLNLQLEILAAAYQRARAADPAGFSRNANVKLFRAIARLMLEDIPRDPARPDYRQGDTLGPEYRHWFRAKFGGRFRLFYRYDSRARLIVYAWVNDETTLRKAGARSDPYDVFRAMLKRGDPPDEWRALLESVKPLPAELANVKGPSSRPDR